MSTTLILVALATWRITSLFVNESGPFGIFANLRKLVGVFHIEGSVVIVRENVFSGILSCMWCASMYVGAFWAVMIYLSQDLAFWISLPFALSSLCVITNTVLEKLR